MHSNPTVPTQALDQGSEWFKYRCRSCDHSEWVEDIVVYAFPPEKPGGTAVVMCPECGQDFAADPKTPPIRSRGTPK